MKEDDKYFSLPKGKYGLKEHDKIWEKYAKILFCVVII